MLYCWLCALETCLKSTTKATIEISPRRTFLTLLIAHCIFSDSGSKTLESLRREHSRECAAFAFARNAFDAAHVARCIPDSAGKCWYRRERKKRNVLNEWERRAIIECTRARPSFMHTMNSAAYMHERTWRVQAHELFIRQSYTYAWTESSRTECTRWNRELRSYRARE